MLKVLRGTERILRYPTNAKEMEAAGAGQRDGVVADFGDRFHDQNLRENRVRVRGRGPLRVRMRVRVRVGQPCGSSKGKMSQ